MTQKWTDSLPENVYIRLCECRTVRADIPTLAQAMWAALKNRPGFCQEDALVSVLELLDSNGIDVDLTKDEYCDILSQVR